MIQCVSIDGVVMEGIILQTFFACWIFTFYLFFFSFSSTNIPFHHRSFPRLFFSSINSIIRCFLSFFSFSVLFLCRDLYFVWAALVFLGKLVSALERTLVVAFRSDLRRGLLCSLRNACQCFNVVLSLLFVLI